MTKLSNLFVFCFIFFSACQKQDIIDIVPQPTVPENLLFQGRILGEELLITKQDTAWQNPWGFYLFRNHRQISATERQNISIQFELESIGSHTLDYIKKYIFPVGKKSLIMQSQTNPYGYALIYDINHYRKSEGGYYEPVPGAHYGTSYEEQANSSVVVLSVREVSPTPPNRHALQIAFRVNCRLYDRHGFFVSEVKDAIIQGVLEIK